MAESHSSDGDEVSEKVLRQRAAWRRKYYARKLRDPDYGKKKYQRYKSLGKIKRTQQKIKYRKHTREQSRKKYAANPKKHIARVVARQRQRYKDDPLYSTTVRLRSRMRYALKAGKAKKAARLLQLVGCTAAELVSYIETLFQPGMTWGNKGQWHIDHIIPVSAFDLATAESQAAAFHYTNLRPIWASDNLRKSSRPPVSQLRLKFGYIVLADEQKSRARKGGKVTERRRA